MSKKKKKAKSSAQERPVPTAQPLPQEERAAELVTVAWMLCALLTLVTVILQGSATAYLYFYRTEVAERHPLYSLMIVLNFIALFAGLLALVLIPAVYKLRKTKPPTEITFFVLLVGTLPWALLVLRGLKFVLSTNESGVE